jgi:RND family efflux transporter MFP subunit
MKKLIVILIVLTGIGLIGWKVYQRVFVESTDEQTPQRSTVVAVEILPIEKTTIRDIGSFTGTLMAKSQFEVAPKISGRLEKLMLDIGDRVKHGDLIATLDDDEIIQQLDQARAELVVSKANVEESRSALENARREYERVRALREKKIASQSEMDTAEANLNVAEAKQKVAVAQVTQKEAAAKAVEVHLSYTQIKANWEDGPDTRVVGEKFVDEGTMLSANEPIISILDIRSLIAVIQIIERDYSKVHIGQNAEISTDAVSGNTFTGTIARIAPLLKETSRQARVEIYLDNENELLKPGMFVRVGIEFESHENTTVAPTKSIVKRENEQGIFLADIENMTAHFVPVKTGITNIKYTEITEPVISGWAVTLGQHLLEDGSTIVIPRKEGMSSQMSTGREISSVTDMPEKTTK